MKFQQSEEIKIEKKLTRRKDKIKTLDYQQCFNFFHSLPDDKFFKGDQISDPQKSSRLKGIF